MEQTFELNDSASMDALKMFHRSLRYMENAVEDAKAEEERMRELYEHAVDDRVALMQQVDGIVRCEDCKKWKRTSVGGLCYHATWFTRYAKSDDYCSWGERYDD